MIVEKIKNLLKSKRASKSGTTFLVSPEAYDALCVEGYTSLDKNPEVLTACRKIADLVSNMTIYLMSNTNKGDKRIKNELSRRVDINPNRYMTRKTWMESIVMNLLLHGNGNSVVLPTTVDGMLDDMFPISPSTVSFSPDGYGYRIYIDGVEYDPENVLHFTLNPDPNRPWKGNGITTTIRDVAGNLKQAAATEKAFMESKWKPSVIVKVDALIEEFSDKKGRKKLLDEYFDSSEIGSPWLIPAEQFEVEQIRPLSLSDLAIRDTVELNRLTVASIIGVPPFILGVGEYAAAAWDNFISSTIRSIAMIIEQEMTRKLLLSPDWYWKLNVSSLYSYDLQKTADVYSNLYVRGIVTGNEVRDKMAMSPMDGLDNLVILENYIPFDKVGEQLKLKQEGEE